jgi:hypothetical protein
MKHERRKRQIIIRFTVLGYTVTIHDRLKIHRISQLERAMVKCVPESGCGEGEKVND